VGEDAQVVVAGREAPSSDPMEGRIVWDYCFRRTGRLQQLATVVKGPYSYGVGGAKLAGTYFGYWESQGYHGANVSSTLHVWNLRTRHAARAIEDDPTGACFGPFGSATGGDFVSAGYLLAGSGVAAWKTDRCAASTAGPLEDIEALNSSTGQVITLDSSSTRDALANLQLYQCAGGCSPSATVVAWTRDGSSRYTTIG
jgi:hypothetical protein